MSKNDLEVLHQHERLSLYDILEAKNQSANRKTILHRIVMVSKLRNNFSNKAKIGEYYDKMFRNQQQQITTQKNPNPFQEKVTGISIIYPTLMVQIIETSLETLKDILKDLETMHNNEDSMIAETRILNIAHEIHIRLFPVYTFKMMNLSLEHESSEPTETTEALVGDILVRLLRMGKFLYDQAKTQLKKEVIDNLHEQHPELFPNQNHVNFLLKCQDLWSPKEYLSYYEKPFNIIFESELSWPAPYQLFPYQ